MVKKQFEFEEYAPGASPVEDSLCEFIFCFGSTKVVSDAVRVNCDCALEGGCSKLGLPRDIVERDVSGDMAVAVCNYEAIVRS